MLKPSKVNVKKTKGFHHRNQVHKSHASEMKLCTRDVFNETGHGIVPLFVGAQQGLA